MSNRFDPHHRGRNSMFLRSDADDAADDVRLRAEQFVDPETRSVFYEVVIAKLNNMKSEEDARGPEIV